MSAPSSPCSTVTGVPARLSGGSIVVVLWALLLLTSGTAHASGEPDPDGAWPLDPRPAVVHGFAPPAQTWGSGHRGVDLAGTPGQEVRAALGGRVTMAGSLAGVPIVVVDHGTVRTTYQPVLATVTVGDAVGEGSVIGTLTMAGSHCTPRACLHWGLIRNGTDPPVYLDPLSLVGALPVRLLPLSGTPEPPAGRTVWPSTPLVPPLLSRPRVGLFERPT